MINKILNELQKLTKIKYKYIDNKSATVKFLDYKGNEEILIRHFDNYLVEAIKLNKDNGLKIKTIEGLLSLKLDLREIYNHGIELGEEYIYFNIDNKFYDKDPYCDNRLSINELEILEHTFHNNDLELIKFKPYQLFTYNKNRITFENASQIINDLIEKEIIKIKENNYETI
jgi:hypothetical protein